MRAGRGGWSGAAALLAILAALALSGWLPLRVARLAEREPRPLMAAGVALADGGGPLYVARYEVTWQEWRRCVEAGGCGHLPKPARAPGSGPFPVVGVNALDVAEYIVWFSAASGQAFRLPSAAEWYRLAPELARPAAALRFTDPRLAWAAAYSSEPAVPRAVRPSGAFGHSAGGVHDLGGNVWEWTRSCGGAGYAGDAADCPAYLAGGLHEARIALLIRDPAAGGCALGRPPANLGFRLVSDAPFGPSD